jgi:Fe(3+) dicitrate transport protein
VDFGLDAVLRELMGPFLDPGSRTAWFALLGFAGVAAGVHLWRGGSWRGLREAVFPAKVWTHASTMLDVQLLIARRLIGLLGFGLAVHASTWVATGLVRALDDLVGRPEAPVALVAAAFPVALFLAWDLSRYIVHRLMHAVPLLWSFHQVHHSAEVESLIYELRGVAVTGVVTGLGFWLVRGQATDWTLLGVNGVGLLLNVLTGNLRHSHLWLRFPAWLEAWLLSPAQHQLHHGLGLDRWNYGTWLAVWDRLGGSWVLAPESAPERFGVADRNHSDDLISAWFGPAREVLTRPARWLGAAIVLLCVTDARAQEEDEEADDDVAVDILVLSDTRSSRIAGSAHKLDEEDLALFEQSNIEEVLATVPGVYSRGEDGFGLRPNIGIRGANSDRSAKLTLLEDGVPAAPAPYASPAAYYFPMVTRMVGVEVFKGPAAVMTGPQTVGGAINLLTRRAPSNGTSSAVDLAAGLRNTGRLHAFVGHGEGRVSVLGEVALLTTTGFKQLDDGGPTGFLRGEGMFKARVVSDPALRIKHALEVKVGYAGERSNETYLGLSIDDLDTPYRRYASSALDLMGWSRTQLEVSWPIELGDSVQIRTTAYHHDLERTWTKVNRFAGGPDLHDLLLSPDLDGQGALYLDILRGEEDSQTADQRIQLGTNARSLVNYGLQSTMRWSASAHPESGPTVQHRLTAGFRLHADRVDRRHTEDPYDMLSGAMVAADGDTTVLLDAWTTADALSAFFHEDLQIGRLSLLPGFRVEAVRTQRTDAGMLPEDPVSRVTPLPGSGVLFEVTKGVQVFGGVYRGFSPVAPGSGEEVKPEFSWNYEVGTRLGAGDGPHAEVVYFQNEYLNLTGQCTVSGGCLGDAVDAQFNGGAVRLQGLEVVSGTRLLLPAHLTLPIDGSYTFTRGVFLSSFESQFPQFGEVEAGFLLPYVPEHQAGGIVALEHPKWRLGLEATGRSGMRDVASAAEVPPEVPALVQLAAAFHLQVAPSWQLYATGSNLTGRTTVTSWRPFGARPVAPTQVMLGLRWDTP